VAPFGSINLTANTSLQLLPGSVTSVTPDGAVLPYGQTQLGGLQWFYNLTNNLIGTVPSRTLSLAAPSINFAANATIDVKGGGDLQAYEWVPGTGGSINWLSTSVSSANGYYAVLPSTRGQYAPQDIEEDAGSPLSPSASLYLTGVAGLPAGVYPLLPASYALLPGAYLVQLQPGMRSLNPGPMGTLTDGTPVIAGYLTDGGSGLRNTAGYTGVAVRPGSYAEALAQYQVSTGSNFFSQLAAQSGNTRPTLPADGGTLVLSVGGSLTALGNVLSAPSQGGLAATIDISATDLTVTGSSGEGAPGGVSIPASILRTWAPGQLVLGGQMSTDGSSLAVTADTVTIESGAQITATEVLAVANDSIDVQPGATVASASGSGGAAPSMLPAASMLQLTGTGAPSAAFLAVSDLRLPIVSRPAAATSATSATSATGTVDVEGGATLSSRGAISIDAPSGVALSGAMNGAGASWSLGSGSIAFSGTNTSPDTLTIGPTLLASLQQAGAVRLASSGAIDLLAPVALGATDASTPPQLTALTLIGGSLNNNASGDSLFAAKTVSLGGTVATAAPPRSGSGTLRFVAGELDQIGGNLGISGDAQTTFQVSGAFVGHGSGSLAIGGDVSIQAVDLTAFGGSETAVSVPSGTLSITSAGTPQSPTALASSLGGHLSFSATSLRDSGAIIVPGGSIALSATQDVTLGSQAIVDAGGINVAVVERTVGAAGGIVSITAGGGLSLAPGATVSVAGAGDAPAGSLSLSGGGLVSVGATLNGSASPGALGGSFSLYAGTLGGGFSSLSSGAGNLSGAGFTHSIDVRVANGDLVLDAGNALTANRIGLTADSGAIDIEGTLSAPSGGLRGSIGLFGSSGVTLGTAGALHADGSGPSGRGGEIELGVGAAGTIALLGGTITAKGSGQMGTLLLRAPAADLNDVSLSAIQPIQANVTSLGQVIIEPVLPAYDVTTSAPNFSAIRTDVTNYMSAAGPAIAGRLQLANGPSLVVEPGVLVQSQGDLTLDQALDLHTWQFNNAPIDLTVQAAGSLTLAANVSDGFSKSGALLNQPSASLRFVAGAALGSPNPTAVAPGSDGNLTLGDGVLVRTGTGDIDLIAAGSISFGNGTSVYTAGTPALASIALGQGNTLAFPTGGGSIVVSAGSDFVGTPVQQSIADWQARLVRGTTPQWGANLPRFGWNLGTLGGGDLSVTAGRDILNLSAATADSYTISANTPPQHFGGGGLSISAGRDVDSGQFFVAEGTGTLRAGRSFGSDLGAPGNGDTPVPVGSLFGLGDAQMSLWAQGDIRIDAVVNPTLLTQPNFTGRSASVFFFTYGMNSSLSAQSSSGTVTLSDSSNSIVELMGNVNNATLADARNGALDTLPSNLTLRALSQDVVLNGPGAALQMLYPSDQGQLDVLAGRDILDVDGGLGMSDAFDSALPTAAAPRSGFLANLGIAASSARHAGDPQPVLFTAGRDIDKLVTALPKPSRIEAGRDIVNLTFTGQNLQPGDLTLLSAGRDFIDPIGENGAPQVLLGGPGRLDVLAGRNVNLGLSSGIETLGNLSNPNLNISSGADLSVLAGLGQNPDYAAFLQKIIEPSPDYQQMLVNYVEAQTGQSNLSVSQAESAFSAFSIDAQRPLIEAAFFAELEASGREANSTPSLGFTRGYTAIDTLFPGSRTASPQHQANDPYAGDIVLTFSHIITVDGGSISLFAPGGKLDVGLANAPAALQAVANKLVGIIAQGPGDVDIYTKNDVNVNSSRIFTLGGGNILIWSDEGSIDAGRGAKSSLVAPPPQVLVDAQGNVTLVYSGAVAGSGIRTIQTNPTTPAGNVDLIAPEGIVNAGDAGIGAAGNINIAAQAVVGASNINFGGTATGVPPAVGNLSASLSSASSAASANTTSGTQAAAGTESKEQAAPLAQAALSWLDVFVTGLGEENCATSDLECLKRQKK
jgi:hypothetical protein